MPSLVKTMRSLSNSACDVLLAINSTRRLRGGAGAADGAGNPRS